MNHMLLLQAVRGCSYFWLMVQCWRSNNKNRFSRAASFVLVAILFMVLPVGGAGPGCEEVG